MADLGVVIVAYNSGAVLLDCLESLLAQQGCALDIVVVDNASPDGTGARLDAWASGAARYLAPQDCPFALAPVAKPLALGQDLPSGHRLRLEVAAVNAGFAAGVNLGLAALPEAERIWVLNPDTMVPAGTARAFAEAPAGFGLAGGRVAYYDQPETIQIDGGLIDRRSGKTGNLGLGKSVQDTPAPARMDFITGASMVASRAFLQVAGPMPEDYFLYYEEVDWALQSPLPLTYVPQALVYHRAGTAIGSPALGRSASAFSLYFKHRARMRFVARHLPKAKLGAWAFSLGKAAQAALKGDVLGAWTILYASAGLAPSKAIAAKLGPAARAKLS